MIEMFFGSGGNIWQSIIWFLFFFLFTMVYPKIIITQMIWKLDQSAKELEKRTSKGKKIVLKQVAEKPSKKVKKGISNFLDFFVIQPVKLDPSGIIGKIEHMMDGAEDRFDYFVEQVAPNKETEEKQNIKMGLSGAISLNQLAKIVRHYVELIRKTKNLQLAMVLQMQLPMIERISSALLDGTEALSKGWPIGDTIGPLVAANMIGGKKVKEMEKDIVYAKKKIRGRTVYIMKAKGPGGRLGKLGKATEKLVKKKRVAKIITVDASAKLEGEKTGKVVEGVGVAIGGLGVDKSQIEDVAVEKNLPLDSIVVKMSQEEAIQPMKKSMLDAISNVIEKIEERIKATDDKGSILVVGVGNTAGVGNNKKEADESVKTIKKVIRKMKKREKERKKKQKKNILNNLFWN